MMKFLVLYVLFFVQITPSKPNEEELAVGPCQFTSKPHVAKKKETAR